MTEESTTAETIVIDPNGWNMECCTCHNKVKTLRAPLDCPHCGTHSPVFMHTVTIVETSWSSSNSIQAKAREVREQ